MCSNITITNPEGLKGQKRLDIDYYNLNGKVIATVVKPLMHLHYQDNCIKIDNVSKDRIIEILKS